MLEFFKYEGAGNDFILVDDRAGIFPVNEVEWVKRLCDRHFGIGADGLMLLQNESGFDYRMKYYNADGRPSSMCGNGGRCITRFAQDLGIVQSEARFIAVDGPHDALIQEDKQVALKMIDVPTVKDLGNGMLFIDTGSPHVVLEAKELDSMNLVDQARVIRYSEQFKQEGVNVNFVEKGENLIRIRTYERGVEDETLACGTGVTAAAIAAHAWGWTDNEVHLKARGGNLSVRFAEENGAYSEIWKTGPATFVFKGFVKR